MGIRKATSSFWLSPLAEVDSLQLRELLLPIPVLPTRSQESNNEAFSRIRREVSGLNDENFGSLNKVPTFSSCPKHSQQTLWNRN